DTYFFSLGFPLSPNGRLMAGINGKYLRRTIPGSSGVASGGGADVGLLFDVFETEAGAGLQLGTAILDARTVMKDGGGEVVLPQRFSFGAACWLSTEMLLALAFENQNSQAEQYESFQVFRAGFENTFILEKDLTLSGRLGYAQRLQRTGLFSIGLGTTWQDWRLDYSLQIPVVWQDAYHQVSLSWAYQRMPQNKIRTGSEPAEKAAGPISRRKEKKQAEEVFAALESAAELEDEYSYFQTEKPKPTPTPVPTPDGDSEAEASAYNMPVPAGPAAYERGGFGVVPEMPGFFSAGGFGGRGGDAFSITQQELRLHVVVNPFSPNGDGQQDRTIFIGRLISEKLRMQSWVLTISKAGEVVKFFKGGSQLPRNLEWDGKNTKGKILSDGDYEAVLRVLDEHEMELAAAFQRVTIRTQSIAVDMKGPGTVVFKGAAAVLPLDFSLPDLPGSSNWRFSIIGPRGGAVYEKKGKGRVPVKISWNPRQRGRVAGAGEYRANLVFKDEAGLTAKAQAVFSIQHGEFAAVLQAAPELFKPIGRGGSGVTFQPQLEGELKVRSWKLDIQDENQKPVRSITGKGNPPSSITWDGKLKSGQEADAGKVYRGVLQMATTLGTRLSVKSPNLQCDIGAFTSKKALAINLVRVQFAIDSADLDAAAKEALDAAAKTLDKYQTEYQLEINGHCDAAEGKGNAVELSRRRAQGVKEFFEKQTQVSAQRMQIVGRGSGQPLAEGRSDEEKAKNRRVEVVLYAQ
ncbi:OmpA family protein, partial [candidate division FCPU426 bacterium]|nr:OmpA family protein [candidate division FCPU426 bacterium]